MCWAIGFFVWAVVVWFILMFFKGAAMNDDHLDIPSKRSEID